MSEETKAATHRNLLGMDWILTLAVLALCAIGTLFVFSACRVGASTATATLYQRQILWVAVGLVCYFGAALMDFQQLRKVSWGLYGVAVFLLVLVLIIGDRIYGAKRWLDIFGFSLQPSEIGKLAVVLLLADRLGYPGVRLNEWRLLAGMVALVAVPMLLIMKEPDLGSALVLVPVAFAILFVARLPMKIVLTCVLAALLGIGGLVGVMFLPEKLGVSGERQEKITRMMGISPYQKKRLEVFFYPEKDPLGAGWNKRQSEISVGRGGLKGQGFLKGKQSLLGYLPRSVAPTDFIFSVIAEETGFIGSAVVLSLFGLIVVRGLRTALLTTDKFGQLLCVGFVTMLIFHVIINMAMTVGLVPVTGIPLPLLSYGGSFMVVVMTALGVVQSVHIRARRAGSLYTADDGGR
jgi:rod shape determining protein RodA